jgi:transposase-like protein
VKYSAERKEAILKKMLPPHNKSIKALAQEEGISEAALYNWRSAARNQGRLLPDADRTPTGWNAKNKLAAVIETAALNEAELAEYCRKRGLYPEQIKAWKTACENATEWEQASTQQTSRAVREEQKRIKQLESELKRKTEALAEVAALLVLRKKAQAIWGESEDA